MPRACCWTCRSWAKREDHATGVDRTEQANPAKDTPVAPGALGECAGAGGPCIDVASGPVRDGASGPAYANADFLGCIAARDILVSPMVGVVPPTPFPPKLFHCGYDPGVAPG